ncbi:MAG: hypothetical protein M3R14_01195 [Acidobacteriota bacterium]|nr:hypothetical protein [Acidobacteriota bacterium]
MNESKPPVAAGGSKINKRPDEGTVRYSAVAALPPDLTDDSFFVAL